ncbi:hypothetical protein ACFSYG_16965 [Leeuwenhoekiella polynyae]|uniref:Uncharacterized protein n=1 Tax=Leeuwenhoekiella polynyae TaxID=1550906 RepID=A0A4Q0P126_9FLAO|nr:hypothetical protein [Leeuwenhoekiella polynyae]RXG20174.1 hypothetical protein DSM02_2610 [Leeuwenhoekiella polynyae]
MSTKEKTKADYNSELTKEDLDVLKQKNIHKDGGVDEQLRDRVKDVDFTGKDLDIPTGENTTDIKDEENKLYSQGGSRKNNLEEQKGEL